MAAEIGNPRADQQAAAHLEDAAGEIDRELYRALAAIGASWSNLADGAPDRAADRAREAAARLAGSRYPFFVARAQEALGRSPHAPNPGAANANAPRAAPRSVAERRGRVIEAMRSPGGSGRRAAAMALGPGSLTRREREVARLAARGHTAREIAERLVIGERTVESHLANVYAKLGVESKLDLIRREAELRL